MIGISTEVPGRIPLVRLVFVSSDRRQAEVYRGWLARMVPHVTGSVTSTGVVPAKTLPDVVFAAGENVVAALELCRTGGLAPDSLIAADPDAADLPQDLDVRLTALCTRRDLVDGVAEWRQRTGKPVAVRMLPEDRFGVGAEDSAVVEVLMDMLRTHPRWRPGRTGRRRTS